MPARVLGTIKLADRRASKAPTDEIAAVMAPIEDSFKALREGVATEQQWQLVAGAVDIGLQIERSRIVRGVRGHLTAAEVALIGIRRRAMATATWQAPSLYHQEIEDLDTFLALHRAVQLANVSVEEWQRIRNQADANVRSCGGQVRDAREIHVEQLQLLQGA